MPEIAPERMSFWREALRELCSFIKAEWQWVAVFAAIIAIKQLLAFAAFDPNELVDRLKEAQGNYDQSIAIFTKFLPQIILSTTTDLAAAAIATYVFTVLYLRQFAQSNVPEITLQSFFYWLGKVVWKYWILSWPFLLAALVYTVVSALKPSDVVMNALTSVLVLGSMAWVFYFYYGLYRLYLVTPLAILHREPPLKISSQMTQIHLWRIWWGSIIVLAALFVLFFIPFVANAWATQTFGVTSSQAQALSAVVQGAWRAVTEAALAIYACTVYRILLQEQSNSSLSNTH